MAGNLCTQTWRMQTLWDAIYSGSPQQYNINKYDGLWPGSYTPRCKKKLYLLNLPYLFAMSIQTLKIEISYSRLNYTSIMQASIS